MKKIALYIVLLITIALSCIYFFIPKQITVGEITVVAITKNAIDRNFRNDSIWKKALGNVANAATLTFGNDTIHIEEHLYGGFKIRLNNYATILHVVNAGRDSCAFRWEALLNNTNSPIERVSNYNKAKVLKQKMEGILQQLKLYLENTENIYGIKQIRKVSTVDTLLVFTKTKYTSKPNIKNLTDVIATIKKFITSKNVAQTGNPIYHIEQIDANNFELMVALPVNKEIPNEGNFLYKKMIPGFFMMGEVTGGEYTIDEARRQMHLHFTDHLLTSMAMDYFMMVNDRSQLADTSQWLTRIYLPVY